MVNVSNKAKRVVLLLSEEVCDRIDSARRSTNLRSKQQWIYMAISSYLAKWKKPAENSHLWGPCRHCGAKHDPEAAHHPSRDE